MASILESLLAEANAREDLSKWLVERWCRGKLSAHELVDGARASLRSHPDTSDDLLRRVAKIDPHNAHRDLVRALSRRQARDQPPLYEVDIPLWNADLARCEVARVPMLLPHEFLNHLGEGKTEQYTSTSREISERLRDWKVRTNCATQGPPIAPLSVWGDTAPFNHGHDSVLLLLWSGLGEQWRRRWIALLTKGSLCQCGCGGLHTLDHIWSVVAWSLRALAVGTFPATDHLDQPFVDDPWRSQRAGSPLALRGAVLMFRGDWPWLSSVFQIAYHSNAEACFLCRGRMDMSCPLTDPSASASWRSTCVSSSTWLADRMRSNAYVSGVFSWPGFTFKSVVLDWMHMVDLGCAQACLGNVLWELFRELGGLVTAPNAMLAKLQVWLSDAAHELGAEMPFAKLSLSMIRGDDLRPRLKLKAAKSRALVPIVLKMLEMHFPARSDREVRRHQCVKNLNLAYEELSDWKRDSPERLELLCRRHVLLYLSLSREAVRTEAQWHSWRWYPKHHMLLHLSAEQAKQFGSPRFWWCYMDEGAIGLAVRLAQSCHPRTLARASFAKYLMLLLLEP